MYAVAATNFAHESNHAARFDASSSQRRCQEAGNEPRLLNQKVGSVGSISGSRRMSAGKTQSLTKTRESNVDNHHERSHERSDWNRFTVD
jgi:hypothetical protein